MRLGLKTSRFRRGAAVMVAFVLVARLLLPCLPAQALADPEGADFFVICTPNGVIDLRRLDPALAAALAEGEETDKEGPQPVDSDPYRVCSGLCALPLSLPSTEESYPSPALAARSPAVTHPTDLLPPSGSLRYSLAARAPPLSLN